MYITLKKITLLFLVSIVLLSLGVTVVSGDQQTVVSYNPSEVHITSDSSVPGYVANGIANANIVFAGYGDEVVFYGTDIPYGKILTAEVDIYGSKSYLQGYEITLSGFPREKMLIRVHLYLATDPHPPIIGNDEDEDDENGDDSGNVPGDSGGNKPSVNPSHPHIPDTPDVPSTPDNPPVNPDTPGSDEPGSDEPYLPILPPAGSVYNLAGFIPRVAGFLLLFLVFFWRRKVYRILKSHAKKHGEKPEKEHLKEIADAIIKLVRDEGRYPEWKKNSDVAKRLSADIVSVLDEMNYPKAVPRGALVAEIIKAARGKINRHRL